MDLGKRDMEVEDGRKELVGGGDAETVRGGRNRGRKKTEMMECDEMTIKIMYK